MNTPPGDQTVFTPTTVTKRRITPVAFMMELSAGAQIGEYEVQAQIGEGGMGTVYTAIHPVLGKRVAIKVLKAELCTNQSAVDRFVHEAQAITKIGHPNIVDVYSLGELPDGRAYFVMELLRGEDLRMRLKRGPLAVLEACDILDGIARALQAAHAKQVVHRDLKPDNVFLHAAGGDDDAHVVKLLDFGIAKLISPTDQAQTATGNILGTPRYCSPEQARGHSVDHRSDIYSLGVMAYEMLAGRPPFTAETAVDIVLAHVKDPPPPLAQFARVPRALEHCVMRMLEKDPARRPALDEIRTILVDPSRRVTPMPGMRSGALPRMPAPKRWQMVVGGVAAVLVIGGILWQVGRNRGAGAEVSAVSESMLGIAIVGVNDADVLVDGVVVGRGSLLKVPVAKGAHVVEVRPPNGLAVRRDVTIAAGVDLTVTVAVEGAGDVVDTPEEVPSAAAAPTQTAAPATDTAGSATAAPVPAATAKSATPKRPTATKKQPAGARPTTTKQPEDPDALMRPKKR